MTSAVSSACGRTINIAGKGTVVLDHQGDAKGQGGRADAVKVERQGEGESQRQAV
jgi:hypothetical protein